MTLRTRRSIQTLTIFALAGLLAAPAVSAQQATEAAPIAYPVPATDAQLPPEARGATALWESLQRLHTTASLMMITAHPDDEDGGMLSYEARGAGVRSALFTLTRGEGGQNVMSSADYEALGLIRTHELLRADRYYGVVTPAADGQYWGTAADYGFSKTMEEALEQWGHERVLYDAVRAVRINRPLVVCSVFTGGITDGHGHHQVAGMLAQEVFKAAGDAKVFPDQIAAGLLPWQPRKVYARVPTFSISSKGMFDYATNTWAPVRFRDYVHDTWIEGVPAANVEIEEGTLDPLAGASYLQIGRRGLGEQRTQHEGPFVPLPGTVTSGYHRYGAMLPGGAQPAEHEQTFFDGVDTTIGGLAGLAGADAAFVKQPLTHIQGLVRQAMLNYAPAQPAKIAPLLADGRKQTEALLEQVRASGLGAEAKYNVEHELRVKLAQFNEALTEALGLEVQALVQPAATHAGMDPYAAPAKALPLNPEETTATVTPGEEIRVRVHVTMPSDVKLAKVTLETPGGEHWQTTRLGAPGIDDPMSASGDVLFSVGVPKNARPTQPYFRRPTTAQPFYDVLDPEWRNRSFAPYPLRGVAEYSYRGVPVRVGSVVETMHGVVGMGAIYAPLLVAPEISLTLPRHAGIVPVGADGAAGGASSEGFALPVLVHSDAPGTSEGTVHLTLPMGWRAEPATASFRLRGGEDRSLSFSVHPGPLTTAEYTVKAVAESGGYEFSDGYISVGYTGLTPTHLFRPATYTVRGVEVKVAPGLNVGYVMGTGDEVPEAIEELGIHPHLIDDTELLNGDLSRYDTIVLGIRAYSARAELPAANPRLLEYVHAGGTVVVEYQSREFDHDYAPLPYVLGPNPEKVVNEHAPVVLLDPEHPLLSWPNRITAADFDGWLEERGHSFLQSWSPHFTELTETHDPGQEPQRGGLLCTHYGKGTYIYAAYALYRQTPEGVPGAFRILANLLSAGKAPAGSSKGH